MFIQPYTLIVSSALVFHIVEKKIHHEVFVADLSNADNMIKIMTCIL